ncbi:hypothetical protein [Ralstonia syzygii]|uniref:Uncharacterized protein n=1 Tax=Ralstonia syzygii R24 TaxID=907261 RepID=G3ACA9_9RALS|nr:hypothetical protein [Ralstonia syzygii]CCA87194.1 conserved exported hypothetical protein [Ralstonia syzygii R24]
MNIDFQRRATPAHPAVLLALLLALGALAFNLYRYDSAHTSTLRLQARWLAESQRAEASAKTVAAAPLSPARIEAVNSATATLNLPWDRLLSSVERSLGDDIALLSLQPDPARQQLHLDAEAKDAHAMLDYVAQLGATVGFRNVALKHHEINDQNPYKPYRFQVDMEWQEATP